MLDCNPYRINSDERWLGCIVVNASHAIHAPLMTFYGSLTDEQMALFNTLGQQPLREMSESSIAP
jgi:hypothetical protein